MIDKYEQVAIRLSRIEVELRRLAFWESEAPPGELLASALPFCHDTLNFTQWLQFVFLVRMTETVETGASLPNECGIAPYADEYFKGISEETAELRELLAQIDAILTNAAY